ncbi:MAG: DUF2953 domain-containing protein [Bacillota bacterium]
MINWYLMILVTSVFFLVLIQLIPMQFEVSYHKGDDAHYLVTAVRLFSKIRVSRIRISFGKGTQKKESKIKVLLKTHLFRAKLGASKQWLWRMFLFSLSKIAQSRRKMALYRIVHRLLGNTQCRRLRWVTEIGLTDPATTGIAVGSVWAIKSMVVQQIIRLMEMKSRKLELQVIPNFLQPKLRLDFQCIFAMRIGYITNAIFGLIWWMVNERRAGKG